jgi:hypothetical protein
VNAKTIGVDLWGGQARGVENRATLVQRAARIPRGLRELFIESYARFAGPCREVDEPGLALLAVDETSAQATGLVRIRSRIDRYVASIVGRHDACDLFLPQHADMALRQFTVLLDPVRSYKRGEGGVRYRVFDLRTQAGFRDESDRNLRGLRAEGPSIIRCAGHVIFMLPLGDPTDWPESPKDAWAMLPERVYFDEIDRCATGSMPVMPMAAVPERVPTSRMSDTLSVVTRTKGPRDSAMRLVGPEGAAGVLEVQGPHQSGQIQIGADALRDGILLGRYERCDAHALLDDPRLSRVHALFVNVDDALLIVDTGSRNGIAKVGEPKARVVRMQDRTEVMLGTRTQARWRWTAS